MVRVRAPLIAAVGILAGCPPTEGPLLLPHQPREVDATEAEPTPPEPWLEAEPPEGALGDDDDDDDAVAPAEPHSRWLDLTITHADYDPHLDRVVAVGSEPPRLYALGPEEIDREEVDLPLPPTAVRVDPRGGSAVVGHDGWITIVNLESVRVEASFAIPVSVSDLAVDNAGWTHAVPECCQWTRLVSVDTSTGEYGQHEGVRPIRAGARVAWTEDSALYLAENLAPSVMRRFDTTNGVASFDYDWPQEPGFSAGGRLWLANDGTRIFAATGQVFRASDDPGVDFEYSADLSTGEIVSATSEPTSGRVLVIDQANVMHLFNDSFLANLGEVALPAFTIQVDAESETFAARPMLVFSGSDGVRVLVRTPRGSGVLNDWGLSVLPWESLE